MKDHVTNQEWELFVKNGNLGTRQDEILSSIALRLARGETISPQDQAIYLYHSNSIEELLKSIQIQSFM